MLELLECSLIFGIFFLHELQNDRVTHGEEIKLTHQESIQTLTNHSVESSYHRVIGNPSFHRNQKWQFWRFYHHNLIKSRQICHIGIMLYSLHANHPYNIRLTPNDKSSIKFCRSFHISKNIKKKITDHRWWYDQTRTALKSRWNWANENEEKLIGQNLNHRRYKWARKDWWDRKL